MKYRDRHISIAEDILENFLTDDREKVLHLYLKKYFRSERKYGKRDRKSIGDWVYLIIIRQLLGISMSVAELADRRETLDPRDIAAEGRSKLLTKLRSEPLSEGISLEMIIARFLSLSRTFFYTDEPIHDERVRYVDGVASVPVGISISHIMGDQKFIVQDISSQKIWENVKLETGPVWDVCSGSGGKSLMCHAHYPESPLYCSDLRKGSLYNLLERFVHMGYPEPEVFVADMSEPKEVMPFSQVKNIIADLPCTGSATWHRQPEQALFFDQTRVEYYSGLQRSIVQNSTDFLEKGGLLLYITCSYFRSENEDNLTKICAEWGLEVRSSLLLNYFDVGGDSLFLSVLSKV